MNPASDDLTVGAHAVIAVEVDDRQQSLPIDAVHLTSLLQRALESQGVNPPAEVGLAFIDRDEMTDLNVQHMGGTGPTDVLAFPIDGLAGAPDGQPAMLGDIVICPAVADQAPQELDDELALLVVHGALHLLGHDHAEPEETTIMRTAERSILERYHRGTEDAADPSAE